LGICSPHQFPFSSIGLREFPQEMHCLTIRGNSEPETFKTVEQILNKQLKEHPNLHQTPIPKNWIRSSFQLPAQKWRRSIGYYNFVCSHVFIPDDGTDA